MILERDYNINIIILVINMKLQTFTRPRNQFFKQVRTINAVSFSTKKKIMSY